MIDGGLIEYFNLQKWYDNLTQDEKQKISEYYFAPVGLSFSISAEPSDPQEDPSIIELGDPAKYVNSLHPKLTKGKFLQKIGDNAINFEDYSFAEKVYKEAIKGDDINFNTKHFILNKLIELIYRKRNEDSSALDNCIKYCKMDIEILADFLNEWKKEDFETARKLKDVDKDEWLKTNSQIIDLKEKWFRDRERYNQKHFKDEKTRKQLRNRDLKTLAEWDYPMVGRPFSPSMIFPPRIPSLAKLAIIYEKKGMIKEAIDVCNIALKHGCFDDNTKKGFFGRKEKLERKLSKPKINLYGKEEKASKIKKEKIKRPIITYNQIDLKFDVNINFSVSNSLSITTNYVDYWNQFVNKVFSLINDIAQREIAFLGYRKNFPLPIVTTYQRCEKNPINPTNIINLDLEVFTDVNCSKFVDDLYNILKSINPTNEILSFDVKQLGLLSTSKDGINRNHYEIKCEIKK